MKDRKQALWGILLAVLTSLIILGGVLLSLAENRFGLLAANTPTRPVMEEEMPTLVFILPVVATQTAGSTAEFKASPTPTASLTPLSGCPLPPGWTAIILQNDESSEAISVRYGICAQELAAGNCWDYPLNTLMAGTSIYVPSGEVMISPTAGAWCRPQGESACVPVLVSTTSPTYTPTPTCHKRTGWYAYTVRSGETLLKDAEVRWFEIRNDSPQGIIVGSSTVSAAFHLGVTLGFTKIDFFGCDSSLEGQSHAYQDEGRQDLLWVDCNGASYKTAPDFYLQAQEMSMILRHFPKSFRNFGGGLLQAMVDSEEHDITHVSQSLMSHLKVA